MTLKVYLSGEIHFRLARPDHRRRKRLDISFDGPVTNHGASAACGVAILGQEDNKFWHDHKGAPSKGGP